MNDIPRNGDEVWKRDEVDSPCVKICVMHPSAGICVGCLRTLPEIAEWSRMSMEARRTVLAALPSRVPRLRQRRGGHAARMADEG